MSDWISVKQSLPPVDVEVIAGCWSHSSWLKPKYAWKWLWGPCMLVKDERPCFEKGVRWYTFGPPHSQISHWKFPDAPPERG